MDRALTVAAWVFSAAVVYGIIKLVQTFPKMTALLGF